MAAEAVAAAEPSTRCLPSNNACLTIRIGNPARYPSLAIQPGNPSRAPHICSIAAVVLRLRYCDCPRPVRLWKAYLSPMAIGRLFHWQNLNEMPSDLVPTRLQPARACRKTPLSKEKT